MDAVASVDTLKNEFSPPPFYSSDHPPIVSDTSYRPNVYVSYPDSGAGYDSSIVSEDWEDQDKSREIAKAFTSMWQNERYNRTPSLILGANYDLDWKDPNRLEPNYSKDSFRLIIENLYKNWNNRNKAHHSLHRWVRLFATRIPEVQKILDEFALDEVSAEYFAILSDFLVPLSFSMSDEYEDVYGGKVMDFYRGTDRVSCIISIQNIHILSFINESFEDELFERSGVVKKRVVQYVENLFE